MSDAPGQKRPTDWRYVFVHGVLGWGIPFFVLMLAWDYWEKDGWPTGQEIAALACVSAFGGFVLGRWLQKDQPS